MKAEKPQRKGLVGLIFLGICVVLAAGVYSGAILFPDAMAVVWGMIWWIVIAILIFLAIIGIIFLVMVVVS